MTNEKTTKTGDMARGQEERDAVTAAAVEAAKNGGPETSKNGGNRRATVFFTLREEMERDRHNKNMAEYQIEECLKDFDPGNKLGEDDRVFLHKSMENMLIKYHRLLVEHGEQEELLHNKEDLVNEHENTIARLQSELAISEESCENAGRVISRQKVKIEVLEMDNGDLVGQSHSGSRTKEFRLPDPPLWHGEEEKDELSFETWETRMRNKLDANSASFGNERIKLSYVESRLGKQPADRVSARMDNTSAQAYTSSQELMDHLHIMYLDAGATEKAKTKFKSMWMSKDEDFQKFYTNFLHTAAKAGITEEKDDMVYELNERITLNLREKAIALKISKPTLNEFATFLKEADYSLKQIAAKQARFGNNKTSILTSYNRNDSPRTTTTRATTPRADKVILTTEKADRQRPKYDSATKQILSDKGACFKCEQTGHMARFCPVKAEMAVVVYQDDESKNETP